MPLTTRSDLERREDHWLALYAARSSSASRARQEPECPFRTSFQRDRDRIVHCKAFRRLKHKTQVFLAPTGDHYRTRLTHTLEVSQIARTMARALRLNEDLTEAIALGHDLGHTPFGHAGEKALSELHPEGFSHQRQSLRVVELLEKEGRGLNLTLEVRDGIAKHSKGKGEIFSARPELRPITLEGQLVRASDIIAYVCHDLDDAIRAGLITPGQLPREAGRLFGQTTSSRIGAMVNDLLTSSRVEARELALQFSPDVHEAILDLRSCLYAKVYDFPAVSNDLERCGKIIAQLYHHFMDDPRILAEENKTRIPENYLERSRLVCDFIAGMTDHYALGLYRKLFLPSPWLKV